MAHPSFQSLKMFPPKPDKANNAKIQRVQRAVTTVMLVLTINQIGMVAVTKSGVDSLLRHFFFLFISYFAYPEEGKAWEKNCSFILGVACLAGHHWFKYR